MAEPVCHLFSIFRRIENMDIASDTLLVEGVIQEVDQKELGEVVQEDVKHVN